MKKVFYNDISLEKCFLNRFLEDSKLRLIIGDFIEEYNEMKIDSGYLKSKMWLWLQLLKATPSLFSLTTFRSIMMLKNYLKITFRNFRRHKGYSLINILGLSAGMASCMMILLWVFDELSYGRFHENAENIYRLYDAKTMNNGAVNYSIAHPFPVKEGLQKEYPEISSITRAHEAYVQISSENSSFSASGLIVDPEFLKIFTFPLISGDKMAVLNDPNSVVLSEEAAVRLFDKEDPVGRTVMIQGKTAMIVTGVAENITGNSTITFDYLRSTKAGDDLPVATNWGTSTWNIYLTLIENAEVNAIDKKIRDFYIDKEKGGESSLHLQPYTAVHLHRLSGGGPVIYVYIFSVAAGVILIIACINFMNLTTARSTNRSKEVGMRKVSGARTGDLFAQFMGEATVFSFTAFLLAIAGVILMLPLFSELSGKELDITSLMNIRVFLMFSGIAACTGLLSGIYPAALLASFKPAGVLKNAFSPKGKGNIFRKTLVVAQFSLSIILIISSIIIYDQLNYLRNKDLGIDKENIICLYMNGEFKTGHDVIKSELLANPDIVNITRTFYPPTHRYLGTGGADWDGKKPEQKVALDLAMVDYDFAATIGLSIKEGRYFSREFARDEYGAVLNEAAVRDMGFVDPVGKNFSWNQNEYKIIGVVEDYHFATLKNEIRPQIMLVTPKWYQYYLIKVRPNRTSETIAFLENKWNELCGDYDFHYFFLEDRLKGLYSTEEQISSVFRSFTFLAVFISCLGLFGLASFTAQQRTKEIGIRKTLGSSITSILIMLSKEFTRYVLAANLFAWPVAWFFSSRWLQDYAYRIQPDISLYLSSGLTALIIALMTISYQTIKAARMNPVDSLRYE